jgi:hypothetical protein
VGVNGDGRAPRVQVRIEALSLDGFDPGQRYRIAQAVQRELTRLLAARAFDGALAVARETPRVDAGSFAFRDDDPPHKIGAAIARATFLGLTSGPPRGPDRGA